jgi:hypothetical protein
MRINSRAAIWPYASGDFDSYAPRYFGGRDTRAQPDDDEREILDERDERTDYSDRDIDAACEREDERYSNGADW